MAARAWRRRNKAKKIRLALRKIASGKSDLETFTHKGNEYVVLPIQTWVGFAHTRSVLSRMLSDPMLAAKVEELRKQLH